MPVESSSQRPVLVIMNAGSSESPHETFGNLSSERKYLSYFENEDGDQWLFVCDINTGDSSVFGSDADWAEYAIGAGEDPLDDLVLSPSEATWLQACRQATQWYGQDT